MRFPLIRAAIVLFFMCLASVAYSQCILSGRIVIMTDRSPIVHASVYINNTSIGTISDTNGTFILKTSYQGRIDLVISHVAFQKKVISLNPGRDQHRLMISLELKNNTMKEAVIKGDAVQGSIKSHALFMEYFIGTSHFAKKMCNKKP